MNLKKIAALIFLIVLFSTRPVFSETYPEFTGNYILQNGSWNNLNAYELNFMLLQHYEGNGWLIIAHSGFFKPPQGVIKTNNRPRILLFSGKTGANPETTALVELQKLPYNNEAIDQIDSEKYNFNIRYSQQSVPTQLWTFKREIPLRFKPIEGKTGMFLYEPVELLKDGFYVIDAGIPKAGGHSGLSIAPSEWGYHKMSVHTALPFIVGNISTELSSSSANGESTTASSDVQTRKKSSPDSSSEKLGEAVGKAIIDSFFKKE